jgi:hypothetical protein
MSQVQREVFSAADLRVIAKAVRGRRAWIQQRAKANGHEPQGVDQMDRIEEITTRLAEAMERR